MLQDMKSRTYWLDLFTGTTWQEFLKAGGAVSGFRESRWATVQKIQPGDYLICYLTGVSRFIGMLEVMSEPYQDTSSIWTTSVFPCRLHVNILVSLTPETAIPIHELRESLSIFQNLSSPHAWTGRLRGSPVKWKAADGKIILEALQDAQTNPVVRPVDPKKLARRPRGIPAEIGTVTVPESNGETDEPQNTIPDTEKKEVTLHTAIQYALAETWSRYGI